MTFNLETAGALVPGAIIRKTEVVMKVRVLRPFWNGRNQECKAGSIIDLPEGIAKQAVAAKKAEFAAEGSHVSEPIGDPGDEGSKKLRK